MRPDPHTQHSSLARVAHLGQTTQIEDMEQPHRQHNNIKCEKRAMHHTQDPGKVSLTDGAQGANKLSVPEHIASGNAGTRYHRLLHRHCTSPRFRNWLSNKLKYLKTFNWNCVQSVELISADAQHSRQEHHAPLHHQRLPILVVTTKIFPTWWKTSRYMYCILPCNSPQMRKPIEKLQPFVGHLYITR